MLWFDCCLVDVGDWDEVSDGKGRRIVFAAIEVEGDGQPSCAVAME